MKRGPSIAATGIVGIELAYIVHANLPYLVPSPGCYPGSVDVCVYFNPVPWLWIGFATLLFLSAVALLLRKRLGIALGLLTQTALLLVLAHNLSQEIGWSLSESSMWSGIDSWYPDLLFTVLALCVAVGPALTLMAMIIATPAAANRRLARVAALLLGSQLVGLVAAALISFPAAFRGCDYTGPGAIIIADSPGTCPDFADLDFGRLFAMAIPSAGILMLVCVGVWFGRSWALWAGIVWQAALAACLLVMGATLWDQTSQNYWYEWFPLWLSPRYLADALVFVAPVPALAALLASRPAVLRRLTPWPALADSLRRPG